jgi:sugar lactone lactonase YvrE
MAQPDLRGLEVIEQPASGQRSKLLTFILLLIILFGLIYLYWSLTRPPTVKEEAAPGIRPLFSIYSASKASDYLNHPNAVAVAPNGDLYVADTLNHRVVVYNRNGQFKNILKQKKDKNPNMLKPGDFAYPRGVAVTPSGKVFVTSMESGLIVFNANGKVINRILIPKLIQAYPYKDKVYVTSLSSVYVFNERGEIVKHIGGLGKKLGQFYGPNDVVIDSKGRLFVSDSQNMRLQIFDKRGRLIAYKGAPPKSLNDSKRLFGLGTGMTIDNQDRIYIADMLHHTIRIFTDAGDDLGEVGDQGVAEGKFNYPSDITYLGGNTFAVADKFNDRVQILSINPAAGRKAGIAISQAQPNRLIPILLVVVPLLLLLLLLARQYLNRTKETNLSF